MAVKLEIAQQVLLAQAVVLPTESISLEMSWRRILAQEVVAQSDFPPFDRSPLDGYALLANEAAGALPEHPVVLTEIDSIAAGQVSKATIKAGTACRIMTGAPIPAGTTGVVRVEDTIVTGKQVQVLSGQGLDQNICRQGEEIAAGEKVIAPGIAINMGVMGMLAVLGIDRPLVYKQPRVVLIATGSELIEVHQELTPGKIRNSNSYMLSAQVKEAGAEALLLGTAKDDVDEIIGMITAASDFDVCITTGGASLGDYDLIGEIFSKLGITILFERISMKPGMPVLAGVKAGKLYIGLSGNPAAASVAFEQVVRPVLLKMAGRTNWWRPVVKAQLAVPFAKSGGAKRFIWSRCWQGSEGLLVEPLRLQGHGMLKSAIGANALLVVPEDSPPLAAGEWLETLLLVE